MKAARVLNHQRPFNKLWRDPKQGKWDWVDYTKTRQGMKYRGIVRLSSYMRAMGYADLHSTSLLSASCGSVLKTLGVPRLQSRRILTRGPLSKDDPMVPRYGPLTRNPYTPLVSLLETTCKAGAHTSNPTVGAPREIPWTLTGHGRRLGASSDSLDSFSFASSYSLQRH